MRRTMMPLAALLLLPGCGDVGSGRSGAGASRVEWALAIHGGAGVISRSVAEGDRREYLDSLEEALRVGSAVLSEGGTALDAVEKVVVLMEDDPKFNAGRGAVYNHDGEHELDACIMDGRTLGCGAVTGVTTVKNPIILARYVMERSGHVLLSGAGAERFADEMGVERVEQSYFHTEKRRRSWLEYRKKSGEAGRDEAFGTVDGIRPGREAGSAGGSDAADGHASRRGGRPHGRSPGTVGAVALDRHGNLAAATSTGGLTGKRFGRVGDTPIAGAGTYANNATCAVSGTGKGEEFIRHNVAYRISALMEFGGVPLQRAAEEVVRRTLRPGEGGVIAVGRDGSVALVFNTEGMFRGAADSSGRFEVAIWE
ncbi:MAG: isoaspartyl peptidase/L-asparaginase family protein [Acidobacteriota bacterium]